jgi:hypothetical protein
MLGALCDLDDAARRPRIEAHRRRHITLRCNNQALELKAVRQAGERGRIGIVGIPGQIAANWHRRLPARVKAAAASRSASKCHICFQIKSPVADPAERQINPVGLGVARLRARVANSHKLSCCLLGRFTHVATEDLNIKPSKLSERDHRCDRGCVLHRHVAAARIVELRANLRPGRDPQARTAKVEPSPSGDAAVTCLCGRGAASTASPCGPLFLPQPKAAAQRVGIVARPHLRR